MSEKKKKSTAGCLSEFIFCLLAVLFGIVSLALVVFGAISKKREIELLGIGVSVAFALFVFVIPYFRRNGYIRWLAWASLADAAWWGYQMFSENSLDM